MIAPFSPVGKQLCATMGPDKINKNAIVVRRPSSFHLISAKKLLGKYPGKSRAGSYAKT
jgi:hypothetical protein